MLPKKCPTSGYVKLRGNTLEVHQLRMKPKFWDVACEHTGFKGLCINCITMLQQMSAKEMEQEAELVQ